MALPTNTLKWSAQLAVASPNKRLVGDKITLPQSALEALLAAAPMVEVEQSGRRNVTSNFDPFNPYSYAAERQAREALIARQQQLPHPLTFRLVNPANGRAVYAGIREFSAEEEQIQLSSFLREALGLEQGPSEQPTREGTPNGDVAMVNGLPEKREVITVHAHQLPKGTYVRLRPLEAGYDPEDWKSLLERYLRDNFTTLTMNEILDIRGARHEHFRFLVDKFEPENEGICIVDTDLEVDIEALNEEQARETLERRLAKARRAPGTSEGSSAGGNVNLNVDNAGQVLAGEGVDYELHQWDRSADLELTLRVDSDEPLSLDILVSPMSARQRSKPREDEFVFADLSNSFTKVMKLSHRNVDMESAESLAISIHAWKDPDNENTDRPIPFSFSIANAGPSSKKSLSNGEEPLGPDETVCQNCRQKIPKRTLPLHEAFCYRNNVVCPKCSNVFMKSSEAWKNHWHCPLDDDFANSDIGRMKHGSLFHLSQPLQCPACDFQAYDQPILAQHRTSTCPGKTILCQFCHLEVPQQGPDDPSFTDAEVLLSGLTPHELADGARTTECHICSRIVRLRDMKTHLGLHDRERISKPEPQVCMNDMCSRTIPASDESRVQKEQLGLCNTCFGPLYNSAYDPEGKALRRRIERRLLQQLMGGCGKSWCHNSDWCRSGYKNATGQDRIYSAKDALPVIKPAMDCLAQGDAPKSVSFCVDESQQRRTLAANMIGHGSEYASGWVAKAVEETKGDVLAADEWLKERAPKIGEVMQ
ncbi:uncharacterized protein HMPREF1541_00956 [Cyphellophora europaea CBS 101466]|uniref:Ubiquitin-protein ligase E3A N-terminal zinc-binding domain-containing protein n=1 Tax=Cyphellophora europaea (strain CBS 101466) TaxID=1220924 RepID=W2SDJ5_CYPE1|nr:uncharacterized protein HMPREF1541_00956 [Cyphellophora europaea CBS 101466]ETN46767.1 hypothetical protein HMPREF1541_00956 [Cyphellophora europaea CBS 101466]